MIKEWSKIKYVVSITASLLIKTASLFECKVQLYFFHSLWLHAIPFYVNINDSANLRFNFNVVLESWINLILFMSSPVTHNEQWYRYIQSCCVCATLFHYWQQTYDVNTHNVPIVTFHQCQKEITELFPSIDGMAVVVVGHALENDFDALEIKVSWYQFSLSSSSFANQSNHFKASWCTYSGYIIIIISNNIH